MKSDTNPVVQCFVEVTNAQDLPKLVEGLGSLAKSDPLVLATTTESGEHCVAGASVPHLETCLKDLEDKHAAVPLRTSDVVVCYRETVQARSGITAMSKSPNKHNNICMVAEPIDNELSLAIETGKISTEDDPQTRANIHVSSIPSLCNMSVKIATFSFIP
ncbi:hypothetical protein NQ176_g9231 [Zarea fungicola]|uniref:Uncharacterized protein n=1 Tax=Zarea fungicola TaxID=93591 RepID=A0ACC1MNS3_9HYPO|nr:hypothetical protein NQ176_g9231 [Lecanicillium fungicola]